MQECVQVGTMIGAIAQVVGLGNVRTIYVGIYKTNVRL